MVPEIIFQKIVSTPDGVGATEGRYMEKAFNDNFNSTKSLLEALFNIVTIQVSSNDVTQLRVDTSTNPYSVYYTLDPLTTENPTWTLLSSTFASLSGEPTDNIGLKTALDNKASRLAVDNLTIQVNKNTEDLTNLKSTTSTLNTSVGALDIQVQDLSRTLTDIVRTDEGTLYIRYNALTNSVEYSLDKITWSSVIASNITFADITGSPENNTSLSTYIQNQITLTIDGLVTSKDFLAHLSDKENPHNVTAEQLGLGNVLNELAALTGSNYVSQNMTSDKYLNTELDSDDIMYHISSHYTEE